MYRRQMNIKHKYTRLVLKVSLIMLVVSMAGCTNSVELIAHRGDSYLFPENTLASVVSAWQKGFDAEIDVHLSKDNRIMVIHDADTKRTAGIDLKIKQTDSHKLRELEVGSFKDAKFLGEPIPFLEEILRTIPPGRRLFVEVKCGPEILPYLQKLLDESGKRAQIVIIGFDLETMVLAKQQMPDIPVYWLTVPKKDKKTKKAIPYDPQLVRLVRDKGLDGLDVYYAGVDKRFMDAVKASRQKLYTWTVDDAQEAKHLIKLGVDGITTNRPEWLKNQL